MPQTEFLDMPLILPTRLLEFFCCCFGSPAILWLPKVLNAGELGYDVINKLFYVVINECFPTLVA
jgi:hypothetical protein